jgi:hypothetical protein
MTVPWTNRRRRESAPDLPAPPRTRHRRRAVGVPRTRRATAALAALGVTVALTAAGSTLAPTPAVAAPAPGAVGDSFADEALLRTWLADTYTSLEAMTTPATGLVADNIESSLDPGTASAYTSPTNIGGYLWSTVVARDLGLLDAEDAHDRMATTLTTLAGMDRHDASGMYYNWYDPATGDRVDTWPDDGAVVEHFLSSVDNGWLAAALRVVASAEPRLADRATALYDSMHFGIYYNPDGRPDLGVGLIRGGFWDEEPSGCSVPGSYQGGDPVYYTCHHYDTTVSETRIALYLGIADGEIPPEAYWGTHRAFPSTCDWSWQEQRPSGVTRTYDGIDVYEGVYHYRGMAIVPGWGGSMFEALMPDMLVPESEWAPRSWGVNHPLVVEAQKQHGLDDAGYGYWGFSPASNPHGGYAEYGVDALGLRSDGYLSDGTTDVDLGFHGCREATNADPEFGDGVVTPHAAFLGLEYDPRGVVENLQRIAADFDAYGPGGFADAVAVRSGTVAQRHLSLDQAMIVAAIGNYLGDGLLRDHVVGPDMEERLRPVLAKEVFSASVGPIVPVVTEPAPGSQVARIDRLGGTGEPGAQVAVTVGAAEARDAAGDPWCTAAVDPDGVWACTGEPVTDPGVHVLAVSTTNDAGIAVDGGTLTLTVAAAPVPEQPGTGTPDTPGALVPGATDTPADPGAGGVQAGGSQAGPARPGLATTGAPVGLTIGAAAAAVGAGTALVRTRRRAARAAV